MRETDDRSGVLDRDSTECIADNFEDGTDEDHYKVVGLVLDKRLVELYDDGDKVEDCGDDGEREIGIVEPDGVGVGLPVLGHNGVPCLTPI